MVRNWKFSTENPIFPLFYLLLKVINKADKINQLEKLNLEYESQIKNLERDLQEKHDEVNEITEKMSVCERNLNSTRNSICPEKVSRRYLAFPIIAMPFNWEHNQFHSSGNLIFFLQFNGTLTYYWFARSHGTWTTTKFALSYFPCAHSLIVTSLVDAQCVYDFVKKSGFIS